MKKFREGEFVQLIHNCKVNNQQEGPQGTILTVTDIDRDIDFQIRGDELALSLNRCETFEDVKKVNKGDLLERLKTTRGKIFSCVFVKANNEERYIQGIYAGPDEGFGRSFVVDLEKIAQGDRNVMRLLDHRTIQYIIVDNTKYVLK